MTSLSEEQLQDEDMSVHEYSCSSRRLGRNHNNTNRNTNIIRVNNCRRNQSLEQQQPHAVGPNPGGTASSTCPSSSESSSESRSTGKKDTAAIILHPEIARYGFRNYTEICIYIILILCIIFTTTFSVIVAMHHHHHPYIPFDLGSSHPVSPIPPVVDIKSVPVTVITDQEELDILLNALSSNHLLCDKAVLIPSTVHELQIVMSYISRTNNNTATMTIDDPYLVAAAYIIHNDTTNIKEHVIPRYALATMYYTTSGSTWYNRTNWLSNEHYCHWHGVTCCNANTVGSVLCTSPNDYGRIIELDLYQNNLIGTISPVITLLPYLQSIFLSENKLMGTIPGIALGNLIHVMKFHASYNELSGTIPSELKNNGIFSTLYVQGNDQISGTFPFCASARLYNFGIDCRNVHCDADCCDPIKHCFHLEKNTVTV